MIETAIVSFLGPNIAAIFAFFTGMTILLVIIFGGAYFATRVK